VLDYQLGTSFNQLRDTRHLKRGDEIFFIYKELALIIRRRLGNIFIATNYHTPTLTLAISLLVLSDVKYVIIIICIFISTLTGARVAHFFGFYSFFFLPPVTLLRSIKFSSSLFGYLEIYVNLELVACHAGKCRLIMRIARSPNFISL